MNSYLKKFFKLLMLAVFLTVSILSYLIWTSQRSPKSGGDFSLTYKGKQWQFSNEPRSLNLLYFGYAKCPDVCPLTLSFAGGAFKKLTADELKKIRLLFLSVDQEHDDPAQVAEYATNFFSEFVGLSGSREQIDKAIGLYPASYIIEQNPKSYLGYSISHSDRIYFLNKDGIMIDSVSSPRDSELILNKIRENL